MKEWTPEWLVDKFRNPDLDNDILIGIDELSWQDLRHAHGSADDIPPLLRAILSDVHEHGDFALELLFETIWHQGTVYQATRFVTPFLIQLLQSDSVFLIHRISIVHLLACMANGNSYFDVHYELDPAWSEGYFAANGTNKEEVLEKELRDVKLARESVLNQKEQLLGLIDHPNEELACNVYMLLGGFQEFFAELFPRFVEKYDQESVSEKKNAILESLRRLALANNNDNLSFFRRAIQEEDSLELRAIAALALIETQKQSYDAFAMITLLDFVKYRVANEEKLEDMPSWKYVYEGTTDIPSIAKTLIELSSPSDLEEFNVFITLIKKSDSVFDFVQDLFFHLFQNDDHKEIFSMYSSKDEMLVRKYCRRGLIDVEITEQINPLPAEFIPILKMVMTLPLFWKVESNLLNVFGLPHSKNDITKLLEELN